MKTYLLRADIPGAPRNDDQCTLKVWRKKSVLFIRAACERRGLSVSCRQDKEEAFLITVDCTMEQFEAVREEFNGRHRR